MTTIATRYGAMQVIERDSTVCKALVLYGEWAQLELDLLARFISPGACVLDAGAFIGTHTLAFACMAGVTGQVHAFEPRREIFAYLQHNIETNGLAGVYAHNVALGAQPAELAMDTLDLQHADNFGGLALALPHDAAAEAQYQIAVVTLDGMALPPVDLIKLDVEGMESEVLAGAQALIARDRPVIFAECNTLDNGAALLGFAQAHDYRVFGSVTAAYNAANFNNNDENVFGTAQELGLLLLPRERLETYQPILAQTRLPEVESIDHLACLLLSKPQYFYEVMTSFCTKYEVTPVLPNPKLAAALAANERCEAALSEVKALAVTRLDEIAALTTRVELEDTALKEAQRLAFARQDEITMLKTRSETIDAALSEAQGVALEQRNEIAALKTRVELEGAAHQEAQQLALARLDEITTLTARVELEDTALKEAQRLAFERQDEITALQARGEATDAALREAQRLAFARLDEITSLKAWLEVDEAARLEAQQLARARLDEIEILQAQAKAADAALRDAQHLAAEQLTDIAARQQREAELHAALTAAQEHAQALARRLDAAEQELQALGQTSILRTLRKIGLMKVRK